MSLPPLSTQDVKVGDDTILWHDVQNNDDSPIDTTGWRAEFSINKARKGGLGDFTYLSDTDPDVVDVVPGSPLDAVRVHITPELSRLWTNGKGVTLQVEVTIWDSNGLRLSIWDGAYVFRGEVRYEPEVGS